jgi:hypothetical protein
MKSSFAVGAIAGLIAGFWSGVIQNNLFPALGIVERGSGAPFAPDIYFVILNAIPSIGYNAIWGAFFGLIVALFFDRIPGKIIMKGLIIGIIWGLFATFQPGYSFWAYDNYIWAGIYLRGLYFIDKFIYGIIFAALYKK